MNLEDKVLQLINKQIDDDVEFRTVLPTSKAIAKIIAPPNKAINKGKILYFVINSIISFILITPIYLLYIL